MKYTVLALAAAGIGFLLSSPPVGFAQDSNASSKLEVHVNYSGAGTVDEKHKVYVVLWDSADFVKGGGTMPSAIQSTSSKGGTVTFDALTKTPVYVSAVYDPSGEWTAQSEPPDGSSLGLYSTTPGQPEPVNLKPAKTSTVELGFDDSVKMKRVKATPQ